MGAILLGSAGQNPMVMEESSSIPIPQNLPTDPTVLMDTPPIQNESGGGSYELPVGGTLGQLLAKASSADYDVEWIDAPEGGGGITPVSDILEWITDRYSPYSTRTVGSFYRGTIPPTDTTRLSYDGSFWASDLLGYSQVQTNAGGAYTRITGQSGIGELSTWNLKLNIGVHGQIVGSFDENKGFTYNNDYSANWTDHSLVTKKWVTDNFSTGGYPPPEDTLIYRTNGLISQVVKETKTINITRDINGLISYITDGTYRKDIVRVNGVITEVQVSLL